MVPGKRQQYEHPNIARLKSSQPAYENTHVLNFVEITGLILGFGISNLHWYIYGSKYRGRVKDCYVWASHAAFIFISQNNKVQYN